MKKDCSNIFWDRVGEDETVYILSKFDLCERWRNIDHDKHPLVYFSVPATILLPVSDAFQERSFSACTVFDNPIHQHLTDR